LLSKAVKTEEIGKIYSLLAVISAVAPMIGNPVFRQIYNFTLNSYPGAVFFIFAGTVAIAVASNVVVFLNRNHLKEVEAIERDNGKETLAA
jgi:hypothetical protein